MKIKDLLRVLISGFIFLFVSTNFGQATQGSYGWAKRIGGDLIDTGESITADSSGNVYIMGSFSGTVDFGDDFGTTDTKTVAGWSANTYITRINANGTYGWTKRIPGRAGGAGIAIDPFGNLYITGGFLDTVDFGGDFGTTDTKTSAGSTDVFVTRINANGTYGWTKKIGGASWEIGESITTDSSGNVYVTGGFDDTVDFGDDFGTTDTKTSAGDNDIFVTRINANGAYGWTKRMGGVDLDTGQGITTDLSDNVYVTGRFNGTVDFGDDFGITDTKTSAGDDDIFVTRINANGAYGWTKRMGGVAEDSSTDITTDSSGNVYVTGAFMGTVDFGDDFGTTDTKTSAGIIDIFVTRIKANGAYGWTKRMGGLGFDTGQGITTDPSGNLYITGDFSGAVDFGGDFGTTDTKTSAGSRDVFVTRINANGAYGWTKRMGGTNNDRGESITAGLSGNVYVTGHFMGTVDFGDDFGITDTKTSAGDNDMFITYLRVSFPVFDGHDFDGNGLSDVSVWRPSNGRWYIKEIGGSSWGQTGDIPVQGNYDFDTATEIAVWRPSDGLWYISGIATTQWGTYGDIPVPHDYNGDDITDLAVWRPSDGVWYINGVGYYQWGQQGDYPVPGDYNGDGVDEIAVWRPAEGTWYISGVGYFQWGTEGDIPVPADYNGDGKTDLAVFRPAHGIWYIQYMGGGTVAIQWGTVGDVPVPGDYEGDGTTEVAIWRPSNGLWYIYGNGIYQWGTSGDIPLVR